jgi:hypothetical protein
VSKPKTVYYWAFDEIPSGAAAILDFGDHKVLRIRALFGTLDIPLGTLREIAQAVVDVEESES